MTTRIAMAMLRLLLTITFEPPTKLSLLSCHRSSSTDMSSLKAILDRFPSALQSRYTHHIEELASLGIYTGKDLDTQPISISFNAFREVVSFFVIDG